jgi:hypothetical protein
MALNWDLREASKIVRGKKLTQRELEISMLQ